MIDLILAILCAYRLTQLVIWDDLLSPVTCWLANRHRLLDELFGCVHCMGFWCALVSVVAVSQDHWLIRIGVWAFAVSGAVSMIQHATGWLDTEIPLEAPGTRLAAEKADRVIAAAKKTWDASVERYQAEKGGPLSNAEIFRMAEAEGYIYKGGYEPEGEGE